MGKRRADADSRRFFDEFERVKTPRLRALGIIDPAKDHALIEFKSGKTKLIATQHSRFPSGGGWSYFVCPGCARRATSLYLIDDMPRCCKCCDAMNIKRVARYGFGRATRREAADKRLDQLIARLESQERETLKPLPPNWCGASQIRFNTNKRTARMRRAMVSLRLAQLASQQAKANKDDTLAYQPLAETRQIMDVKPIWRANTPEALDQALDHAQIAIANALNGNNPKLQIAAAALMMRTKAARQRGL